MRNVVPRTPATAFSVSTSNFCSPWSTEVTFAQSLPKNNLALSLRRAAAAAKCASASWSFALLPNLITELSLKRISSRAFSCVSMMSPCPTAMPLRSSLRAPVSRDLCALPSSAETCAVFGAAPAASAPIRLATASRLIRGPSRPKLEIDGIHRQAEHAHGELAKLLRLHLLREFLGRAQIGRAH